ncbi:hypothetical protein Nepgr_020368 [Nepenthes gracilis]|uniref:Uncharacterized protein n=1 Tax=Nepenthes gracilis TaxID=150966 RepID=A0AAD3SY02_NEPGR|nr:hypothetical protein Nepgr_020368 [Nepenthes gracilis]
MEGHNLPTNRHYHSLPTVALATYAASSNQSARRRPGIGIYSRPNEDRTSNQTGILCQLGKKIAAGYQGHASRISKAIPTTSPYQAWMVTNRHKRQTATLTRHQTAKPGKEIS